MLRKIVSWLKQAPCKDLRCNIEAQKLHQPHNRRSAEWRWEPSFATSRLKREKKTKQKNNKIKWKSGGRRRRVVTLQRWHVKVTALQKHFSGINRDIYAHKKSGSKVYITAEKYTSGENSHCLQKTKLGKWTDLQLILLHPPPPRGSNTCSCGFTIV